MAIEEDFLRLLQSGDREAFFQLVSNHRKSVLNLCYRFLLNREEAEDIAQEVFVEIFHSVKHFRKECSLSTWIYRIAVTKSLDELKRRSRKKRISSIGKTFGLELVTNFIAGSERPDKSLEEQEELMILMKSLEQLHESQRIALTLSKIEGYSNADIAEIMQVSQIAVESLIYRAKQNLKQILGDKHQK